MTIALLIKVDDGVVLASDSASTLATTYPNGQSQIHNVYNNANKIFNLHKGLPIGGMTWGLGNIGHASVATISKDLRQRFQADFATDSLALDKDAYSISEVAEITRRFLYDDHYLPAIQVNPLPDSLGFLVAGYSSGANQATAYVMHLGPNGSTQVTEVLSNDAGAGAAWWGQPEAISRLLNGLSQAVPQAFTNLGIQADQAQDLTQRIQAQVASQVVTPAMPIQDAIDLAEFLVNTTIQYVRFLPGHPTVGGPIELAVITKHEGFKWIKRKHFFDSQLNPGMPG